MRERNPFLIRSAERISSEDEFIKLFSPKIIEIVKNNLEGYSLWNQFFRFQSSPGGGKTSLLRLFSFPVLSRLKRIFIDRIDSNSDIDSLYKNLMELEAFNRKDEIDIFSIYISCASDYLNIENIENNEDSKNRLFITLLNSRILVAFVRAFIELLKIQSPKSDFRTELKKLTLNPSSSIELPSNFPLKCNGLILYEWASNMEKSIYRKLDGFENHEIEGHNSLFSVQLLSNNCIEYQSSFNFPSKVAIFLDDVQKLSVNQYKYLTNQIIEKRPQNGIWFAERLDLFNLNKLWSKDASTEGRDYVKEINLEELFRKKRGFREYSINIADKRIERAKDNFSRSFPSILMEEIEIDTSKINELITKVKSKIYSIANNSNRYENIINHITDNSNYSSLQTLYELRIAQVLIERLEKKQRKIPTLFTLSFPISEFEEEKSKLSHNNSKYLLRRDYDFPFYFGYKNLVGLASSNVEQFLAFSGRLFEDFISSKVVKNDMYLGSAQQEAILKKEAEKRWNDLGSLSSSKEIKSFLTSFAKFCSKEDDNPGFSYKGVTGFGLEYHEREKLINNDNWHFNPHYEKIAKVLRVLIANNLIEVILEKKQGQKQFRPKTVFYLNRWICLKFGLSFGYSGWRTLNLEILGKWIINKEGKMDETNQIKLNELYGK